MKKIEFAYINALLADASYVSLESNSAADVLVRNLRTRMTPTQAQFIADNFEVLNSIETPKLLGSGFDAVVWKGRAESDYAGQIFVSMRGTQGAQDIADDVSLAIKGIPYQQIADMVNWWLANTASAGATEVKQIQVLSIGNFQTFAPSTPTVGTGFLAGLGPITAVNGHSLGGYLATAFTRLFGKDVQSVNTYNSAGFSNVATGNIEYEYRNIANLIGSAAGLTSFSEVAAKQTNYYGENGIEATTNSWADFNFMAPGFHQYGNRQPLYQEDLLGGVGPDLVFNNHYIYKQTDLLALGTALEKLDNTMTFGKLNAFIKAGSNNMAASYEGVLDTLRRYFYGSTVFPTPVGDISNSAFSRVTYQSFLADLQKDSDFKKLQGKIILKPIDATSAAAARIDFGVMAALLDLSPFALVAKDESAATVLDSIWRATGSLGSTRSIDYSAWLADKGAATPTTFTDQWIADRAAMLAVVNRRNIADIPYSLIQTGAGFSQQLFNDISKNIVIRNGVGNDDQRHQFVFGDGTDRTISGGGTSDHLYAGRGNDTLNGLGGDDYLEADGGNDLLDGGSGNDTLVAGTGNVTLVGGAGNDALVGGGGNDTFKFSIGDGRDTITGANTTSSITVTDPITGNTTTLTGGKAKVPGSKLWQNPDGSVKYTLIGSGANQDLLITYGNGDSITIKDFKANEFGISLTDGEPIAVSNPVITSPSPVTSATIFNAQQIPVTYYGGQDGNYQIVTGGGLNEVRVGNGNSSITGGSGNDIITFGGGNSWIAGNGGQDVIASNGTADGANGNNVITANGGQDVISVRNGDNRIYGGEAVDILTALTQTRSASASMQRGNFINVGGGNNTIVGGNGNDAIILGGGNNLVIAGPGNVTINGGLRAFNVGTDWSIEKSGTLYSPVLTFNNVQLVSSAIISSGSYTAPGDYAGNYDLLGNPVGIGNSRTFGVRVDLFAELN